MPKPKQNKNGKANSAGKNKKKTSSKDSKDSKDLNLIKSIVRKTLSEMAIDIQSIDSTSSKNLLSLLSVKTDNELLTDLQDVNSQLVKCVPTDILAKNASGMRYLQALAIVQPHFKTFKLEKTEDTKDNLKTNQVLQDHEKLVNMITQEEGGNAMLDLTKNIMKDLKLEEQSLEKMDMKDMMRMLGNVKNYVGEKVEKGELDLNKLQKQTMSMLSNLQGNKEFESMLKSTEGMLKNTEGSQGIPDLTSMMGAMGGMDSLGALGQIFGGGEKTDEQKQAEDEANKMLAELGGLD